MSNSKKSTPQKLTDAREPLAMTPVVPGPEERGRQPVDMTPVQPPAGTEANVPASQPETQAPATQTPAQNSKK
jgi:hypothetical protein